MDVSPPPPSQDGSNLSVVPKNQSTIQKTPDDGRLRDDLISTAVKFLQQPKVRQTPLSYQKAFLAKKGLTDVEIQEALSRAGTSAGVQDQIAMPYHHQPNMIAPPPPRPLPVTWRDYATAMMFVSGATYVTYNFVRRHVLPSWFNIPDPEQERLRRLDENMNDVQNGLKFLVDSVQQTLGVVQQQQETLNRLVNQLIEKDKTAAVQERAIQDLKNEITTIKSLLLNRDQFAPLPTMASTTSTPSIPAWQLTSGARDSASLVNGNHRSDSKRFLVGADGEEDDDASVDGYPVSEEQYLSAPGSEIGEKMTPV